MTKITIQADYRNTPKKEVLKDFNVAFATGDSEYIIQQVSEDIRWIIYADNKLIEGKNQFTAEMNIMKNYIADELIIHSIIIQDNEGSVNGKMRMGDKVYAFCDVCTFVSGDKNIICEMKSYVHKIKDSIDQ